MDESSKVQCNRPDSKGIYPPFYEPIGFHKLSSEWDNVVSRDRLDATDYNIMYHRCQLDVKGLESHLSDSHNTEPARDIIVHDDLGFRYIYSPLKKDCVYHAKTREEKAYIDSILRYQFPKEWSIKRTRKIGVMSNFYFEDEVLILIFKQGNGYSVVTNDINSYEKTNIIPVSSLINNKYKNEKDDELQISTKLENREQGGKTVTVRLQECKEASRGRLVQGRGTSRSSGRGVRDSRIPTGRLI